LIRENFRDSNPPSKSLAKKPKTFNLEPSHTVSIDDLNGGNMSVEPLVQTDPIAEYHQRFIEAVKAGDIATIVSLYTDTAVFMPPNDTSLWGSKELEEWHEEYFADFKVVTFAEIEREVTVMDGWAVERWAYMVAIQPLHGGERIRDDGRFLAVWKRDGGVWRMTQTMFNSMRPIGSGTSRFLVRLKNRADRERG
jgi:ketosteroid isomerase-like protein